MNYLEYIKSIPKYQNGGYFLPTPDVSTNPDAPVVDAEQRLRNELTNYPKRFYYKSNNARYDAMMTDVQDQLDDAEQFRDELDQLGVRFKPVDDMGSMMPLINLVYDVKDEEQRLWEAANRGEISEADAQKLNALKDLRKRLWDAYDTKSPKVDSLYNKSREYWKAYTTLKKENENPGY